MLCAVAGERGGFRMRAAWYERAGPASEVLTVREIDAPRPDSGEVLVRVRASGVNPGEVKKRADWRGFGIGYPRVIPHSDGAGTIEEVGEGISSSRVGQRVWVWGAQSGRPFGTAAQYTALPETQAVPCPTGSASRRGPPSASQLARPTAASSPTGASQARWYWCRAVPGRWVASPSRSRSGERLG